MRVADYVVKRIEDCGVSTVFMITGRGLLYLTDAVVANKSIQAVSMHNEQALSYAAYAYSEQSENIGVCMVSTGCAATNAITGVMCAWQDNVPMIVISGQNMLDETTYHTGSRIRTYGQQENNIISIVKPITKYAVMVENKNDIAAVMDKAIYEAIHGRKGPVWVDIPLDIQSAIIEEDELKRYELEPEEDLLPDTNLVAELLRKAQRPVVLVGGGIRKAGAVKELTQFIEKLRIPLVYNLAAADIYSDQNELSIGAVGSMGGTRAGNFTIQNADLVLSIGCRLNTMLTGIPQKYFAREAKIVCVDIDDAELNEYGFADATLIRADAKAFIVSLCQSHAATFEEKKEWVKTCVHWKSIFSKNIFIREGNEKIDLYEVAEALGALVSDKYTIIADAGIEELVIPGSTCPPDGCRIIHPFSQGAMGFAIPAIVGAYFAGASNIVCVVGDGSIMMNIQELETIRYLGISAKIIVINNGGYAVIKQRQEELFRKRTIGTDDSNGVGISDFGRISICFGLAYIKISGICELQDKTGELLSTEEPTICEIICREDQPFLKNSYAMSKNRRLLRRSLEDQYPFLDRQIIKNEMLIEPAEFE